MKKLIKSSKEQKREIIKILVEENELKGAKQIIIKKGNKLYIFESIRNK